MGNHVHLLVETPDANLGKGMQSLHGGYAQRINQCHGTKGALFESRYGCVVVENDALAFNAGSVAEVRAADLRARLVV